MSKNIYISCLFILLFVAFAALAYTGSCYQSADGVTIDSDLQTYAQHMAGEFHRSTLTNDPVLAEENAANSIWNIQRSVANFFIQNNNYGKALLLAGTCIIGLYFIVWYLFGLFLYQSPLYAFLLTCLTTVTVWVGWGTFWGIMVSDPVPRALFTVIWPIFIVLAYYALNNYFLRLVTLFLAGLCIWVHGVSALNNGAMLFAAFFFYKPKTCTLKKHILTVVGCLVLFLIPVYIFLHSSLVQQTAFTAEDMTIFRDHFFLRWAKDYGHLAERLLKLINPFGDTCLLFIGGLLSGIYVYKNGTDRLKKIATLLFPSFILALFAVVCISWGENVFSEKVGRLPLGHELVRGLRFLVPMSWIMIASAIFCIKRTHPKISAVLVCVGIGVVLCFSHDRQSASIQYELARLTGIEMPLAARAQENHADAELDAQAAAAVSTYVPVDELVFSPEDAMFVRYVSLRPLYYVFKDGFIPYYNKDVQGCKAWYTCMQQEKASKDGYLLAWKSSKAPWLLVRSDKVAQGTQGKVIWSNTKWTLIHAD